MSAAVVVVPSAALADPLQEFPRMSSDPDCEPPPQDPDGDTITVTIRGYSFQAGRAVMLYFGDGFNNNPVAGAESIIPGAAGSFEWPITVREIGSTSSYSIIAYYVDLGVTQYGIAYAYLYVGSFCGGSSHETITVTPDCGDANTPISMHVDLADFVPGLPIKVSVYRLYDRGGTSFGGIDPVTPPDSNPVGADFTLSVPENGAYEVFATQTDPSTTSDGPVREAETGFIAPCSHATLTPTCPVGVTSDRYSIQITGTGFLTELPVSIAFDSGGTPQYFGNSPPVNADGSFGPFEITPYARGPGIYDVEIWQETDSPILHYTHATFTVPCPAPESATLNPPCASPQFVDDQPRNFQLQVSGGGFQPRFPVTVTFDPDQSSGAGFVPETTTVPADETGFFTATLTVAARPAGTYPVSVVQDVNGQSIVGSVDPFRFPCKKPSPKITSTKPNCGDDAAVNPAAYSIVVAGRGFIPGFVEIIFDVDGTQEKFGATAKPNGKFSQEITPTARPPGAYRIAAQQADVNGILSQDFAAFGVPCVATLLTVTPPATSPGFVVTIHGSGFPANRDIELRWNYGIGTARPITVTVGADGSFDRQVLIFAHDFAGEREVTAGTAANANAFPGAEATLLVAAGQGSPPAYAVFGGDPSDQPPIILRR